ncbi:hypothetical protein HMPREF1008_00889 [Olsenella sp. oral taxon 809 str. F0356]|uniref:hypothetical protein n=1 Tax=Olsenella sp. oral taxon 809 TaxID=661086 RepID=UPI000231ED0E|nr:hypothetical protein [Olsenella sp. oral taxon 809]EHF02183.1 hypothetical protein HMPREF1008_00889 [Olsenella sp. oral taxon 809 str. F0356]
MTTIGISTRAALYSWHNVAITDLKNRPECIHRAYLDPDDHWNGWACPYFEKAEVERMLAWLPEFDDSLVYNPEGDTFTTTYDPDNPEAFSGVDIDGMHLYPIGNGSWTWVIVEEEQSEIGSSDDCEQAGAVE